MVAAVALLAYPVECSLEDNNLPLDIKHNNFRMEPVECNRSLANLARCRFGHRHPDHSQSEYLGKFKSREWSNPHISTMVLGALEGNPELSNSNRA